MANQVQEGMQLPGSDGPVAALQRVAGYQRFTALPVFVLALIFFAASVWFLAGPEDPALRSNLVVVIVSSYLLFVLDFLVRLGLAAGSRRLFFRRNWFEAISLIVPFLRPFVIVIYLWRLPIFRRSAGRLRMRYVVTTVVFMLLFVYSGSSLVWIVERTDPHANIVNLGDAIWWGFVTLATVGYGDFVPVTLLGRVIAVGLMLGGMAVMGVTTAMVVSVVSDQVKGVGSGGGSGVGSDSSSGGGSARRQAERTAAQPRQKKFGD